jgi:hypothetical protein
MRKKVICSKHEAIMDLCEEILELDFDKPFKNKLKTRVNKILKIAQLAKEDGQKMEDRLYEYYNGVTGMGFKRKKVH